MGTLDTKGVEYAYLRDRIREHGVDVILVDAGVLGPPRTEPDITKHEVARAGGADVDELKVRRILVERGTFLRRFRASAKGRASRIMKPTCHIFVTVGD